MASNHPSSDVLDCFLREAGAALLETLGLPATSVAPAEPAGSTTAQQFVGVIGFAGEQVSGALCVTAPRESVLAIQPEEIRALNAGDDVLLDVLNEFANMLLGRIKSLLAHRGVSVLLSTPTAAIGDNLRVSAPSISGAVWYEFQTSRATIHARLNVAIRPGVDLDTVISPTVMPLPEGEMLML